MAEANKPINVAIEPEEPKDMDLSISGVQRLADYGRRSHDKWLMNERSGSSLMFRNNGQTNLAASRYSQYKLNPTGSSQEQTLISQTVTNRKILQADEFVFNNHKFNTQLIDLADFRKMKVDQNQNCVVGNFTVLGSVLVKAWDENLKRYMLIRRPARMSLFSPLLNVPDIMPASQIRGPLKSDEKLVGISDKGYQVNMIIYDHKTRIGKEGEDRAGINRSAAAAGTVSGSASASGITSKPIGGGNVDPGLVYKTIRNYGYNPMATCAIMGNIQQESGFDTGADNGLGNWGLCQWGGSRLTKLQALENNTEASVQLDYMFGECQSDKVECAPSQLNNCGSIEEMVKVWVDYFEISGESPGDPGFDNRVAYANEAYSEYGESDKIVEDKKKDKEKK